MVSALHALCPTRDGCQWLFAPGLSPWKKDANVSGRERQTWALPTRVANVVPKRLKNRCSSSAYLASSESACLSIYPLQ